MNEGVFLLFLLGEALRVEARADSDAYLQPCRRGIRPGEQTNEEENLLADIVSW